MVDSKKREVWAEIGGYEGHYEVSNLGRVKSFKIDPYKGRIRKLQVNRVFGYFAVSLCLEGVQTMCTVSRLVAQAFIANPCNYKNTMHLDGNSFNNVVENLAWGSDKMQYNNNILNGALFGIQDYATDDSRKRSLAKRTGEKNVNAKLTNSQVRKILRDCSKYLVVDLAREYGVSSTVISYILSNKSWKHVKRKKVERKSHIKITPEIKEKIIAEYSKKKGYEITYVSLAKKYGVSHQSIRDVVLGRYVPKEPAVAQEVS